MKKKSLTQKLLLASIFILFLLGNLKILPCTVAVVSGKVTADGRPLMWKNRDTNFIDNKVLYITGAKYNFIGLINAVDTKGEEVWAGINTEGFAIMNAASPDFVEKDKEGSDNGRFSRYKSSRLKNYSICGGLTMPPDMTAFIAS